MKPDLHADVNKNSAFLDRELSQLMFNRRVLAQAEDKNIPLLERLRYLCIASRLATRTSKNSSRLLLAMHR